MLGSLSILLQGFILSLQLHVLSLQQFEGLLDLIIFRLLVLQLLNHSLRVAFKKHGVLSEVGLEGILQLALKVAHALLQLVYLCLKGENSFLVRSLGLLLYFGASNQRVLEAIEVLGDALGDDVGGGAAGVVVEAIDLLEEELLEFGELRDGGGEVVCPGEVLEEFVVDGAEILGSDALQLFLHQVYYQKLYSIKILYPASLNSPSAITQNNYFACIVCFFQGEQAYHPTLGYSQ